MDYDFENEMISALKKHAEGKIAMAKATAQVYMNRPAGIGEHSDVTEAVIAELDKMAAASDRLEMIEKHFSKTNPYQQPITE